MYPYTKQTKAFRETDVWAEHSKWHFRALFAPASAEEGARQQPLRVWKNKWLCNTGSLSDRKTCIPKVCYCNSKPTWGWYQPPVLSCQNVGDPLTHTKKKFPKICFNLRAQWASLKKQCGRRVGRVFSMCSYKRRVKLMTSFENVGPVNMQHVNMTYMLKPFIINQQKKIIKRD